MLLFNEKKVNKKKHLIFFFFFLLIFLSACIQKEDSFGCSNGKTVLVSRIIDGDTIETSLKEKIRLIGINTPEKKEACFEEAKEFLETNLLGKTVLVQGNQKDQYGRTLSNICLEGKSVNKELVENGLAHYYSIQEFPELQKLQETAMKENTGCLWKKGTENYAKDNCIKLSELEFNQNSFSGEFAEFSNDCSYSIDLNGFYLKDEATNIYFFPAVWLKEKSFIRVYSKTGTDSGNELYWNKGNVWNNARDQLFLRNEKGILIVFYSYTNN
ncbi:MAG: thermonuclease family protein [archaeon]